MPRYRYALTALALLAFGIATPPFARDFQCELEKTDAANNWATIQVNVKRSAQYLASNVLRAVTPPSAQQAATSTAPLTLQDFAGRWWHHGMSLTINPDGSADMDWRRGGAGVEIGAATLRVDRIEGRTLYGTVLTANYADLVARGPFELTEYDYGIGVLSDARVLGARAIGAPVDQFAVDTLCGPRYTTAPEWLRNTAPCGA